MTVITTAHSMAAAITVIPTAAVHPSAAATVAVVPVVEMAVAVVEIKFLTRQFDGIDRCKNWRGNSFVLCFPAVKQQRR